MDLFVDDLRKAPVGWVQVDNYEDAMVMLKTFKINRLSLDHDLGTELTGYDIAKELEKEAFLREGTLYIPEVIMSHSANPVGRANIEACIHSVLEYRNHVYS